MSFLRQLSRGLRLPCARSSRALPNVAAAGDWRDIESLRKSYQQVDEKTLLQVMTNPNRLLDIDVKP